MADIDDRLVAAARDAPVSLTTVAWVAILWRIVKAVVVLAALYCLFWFGYHLGRTDAQYEVSKRYYHRCRENLGLFEPMTTLQKGESACAHLVTEDLGIDNRWKDELP